MIFFRNLILSCLFPLLLFAQEPDWVKDLGKSSRFPESIYLTGFGMAKIRNGEDKGKILNIALNYASKNLTEKVSVDISNQSIYNVEETENKFSEYYQSSIKSESQLKLTGKQTLTYFDKDQEYFYAFAYIKKSIVESSYRSEHKKILLKIRNHYNQGLKFEESGKTSLALKEYLYCNPLFCELKESETVLMAINRNIQNLTEINPKDNILIDIQNRITKIVNYPVKNIEDFSQNILFLLEQQIQIESKKTIVVQPVSFQNQKIFSPLSLYLKKLFENKFFKIQKWDVFQLSSDFNSPPNVNQWEYYKNSGVDYLLTGTYWDLGDVVKFLISITSISENRIVSSVDQSISKEIIHDSNLKIQPENLDQVIKDRDVFNLLKATKDGLEVEVLTNKGTKNLFFTENEKMNVFIRVNMPCYIRFIYHLADGKRNLLLDNFDVDNSRVCEIFQIPEEFVCVAPFGVEVLQVFASTTKFEPIRTTKIEDFDILTEDLEKILNNTRGVAKKRNHYFAENRITITTLKN
jgi:hypothetical protein